MYKKIQKNVRIYLHTKREKKKKKEEKNRPPQIFFIFLLSSLSRIYVYVYTSFLILLI